MCTLSVCLLPSCRPRPCAPTWTLWGPPCRLPYVWRTSPLRWLNVTTSPRWRSGKLSCKFNNWPTSSSALSVVSDHPPLVLQVQTRANMFRQTARARRDKNVRKHRQDRWNVPEGDWEWFLSLCAQLGSFASCFRLFRMRWWCGCFVFLTGAAKSCFYSRCWSAEMRRRRC